MSFGMELLCSLSPQELRDFFTGFFRLPEALWAGFLSWRLSGVGNVWMGLSVWLFCIPRRFMPAMLLKSLPFILPELVLPFTSHIKDPAELSDTSRSLYYDAGAGRDDGRWGPVGLFPFLESLSDPEPTSALGRLPGFVELRRALAEESAHRDGNGGAGAARPADTAGPSSSDPSSGQGQGPGPSGSLGGRSDEGSDSDSGGASSRHPGGGGGTGADTGTGTDRSSVEGSSVDDSSPVSGTDASVLPTPTVR